MSISGRGASLRVSPPEPGSPSAPETVPTRPPRLLPTHVPPLQRPAGGFRVPLPARLGPLLPGSLHGQQGGALPGPPQHPDRQQGRGLQLVSPRPAPPSQSWKPSPPWKKETWKARYPRAHSTTRDPRSPLERLSRPRPPHMCTLESLLLSQTHKNTPGAPKTSCPGCGGPPPWPGDHLLGGWPPAVMGTPPATHTHTHTHTHTYWRGHLARNGGPVGTRMWHLGEGSRPQSSPQVTQPHQADI